MVQIQEASRSDLVLHMISAAARDHGPAVVVLGGADEDRLLAELVLSEGLAVELLSLDEHGDRGLTFETYGRDPSRIRTVESLEQALFGKNAWITSRRAAAGSPIPLYEYEATHGVLRFNPLAAWTDAQVQDELRARGMADTHGEPRAPLERGAVSRAAREASPPHR
jgi:hypothetical protein